MNFIELTRRTDDEPILVNFRFVVGILPRPDGSDILLIEGDNSQWKLAKESYSTLKEIIDRRQRNA